MYIHNLYFSSSELNTDMIQKPTPVKFDFHIIDVLLDVSFSLSMWPGERDIFYYC